MKIAPFSVLVFALVLTPPAFAQEKSPASGQKMGSSESEPVKSGAGATPKAAATATPGKPAGNTPAAATAAPATPGSKASATPGAPAASASPAASTSPAPREVTGSPAVVTSTLPPGPAQIVNAFFILIQQGDIDAAYANLTKGSKIAERPDELRTLKAKTKEAIDVFGTVHGYDLVESKPVGERLVRATYLSLGHEYPLRWRFYFYKSESVWKLIDLRVDDKLTGIFEEKDEPRSTDTKP